MSPLVSSFDKLIQSSSNCQNDRVFSNIFKCKCYHEAKARQELKKIKSHACISRNKDEKVLSEILCNI